MRALALPDLRLLLTAAALVAAAGSGFLASSGRFAGGHEVTVAIAGALGLAVVVSQPALGLALLPTVAAGLPFSLSTGTDSRLVAGLLLAMLVLAVACARGVLAGRFWVPATPLTWPTLALMLVWGLAWLHGGAVLPPLVRVWPGFPVAQVGGLSVVVISAGVLLLAAGQGRNVAILRLSVWAFIAFGALAIVATYLRLSPVVALFDTRGVCSMWVVALAYGQALFNRELPVWLRAGLLAIVAAWLYKAVVGQTFWLSGWMPSVAALAVITLLRSRRAFVVLAVLAVVGCALQFDQIYGAVWESQVAEGSDSRLEIWTQAWDLLSQYPVLGTGPAGYAVYYMSLYSQSEGSMSSHSNFVDVAAQTGLLGAAVFGWFLLATLRATRSACRASTSPFLSAFTHGAAGGVAGLLVAMALGDWFIPFVYNQTIAGFRYTVQSWVFIGFLAALAAPERA